MSDGDTGGETMLDAWTGLMARVGFGGLGGLGGLFSMKGSVEDCSRFVGGIVFVVVQRRCCGGRRVSL